MLPLVLAMSLPNRFVDRAQDWRVGATVYQVFVDRFVPPKNLAAKQSLYPTPLHPWTDTPRATAFDPAVNTYPHVIQFWGGDLGGVRSKLNYVHSLGADVLYLLPIFRSPSNHKYDTEDYFTVDPQYGTKADLKALIGDVHGKKMRLVLDGVFNHVGATSALFHDKAKRDWFFMDSSLPNGYRGWAGVASLPALRVENPAVREYLWEGKKSVVRRYLDLGIDGWRLDVGFELGPTYLKGITKAAHATKQSSLVVAEILGYPAEWSSSVDGVFNGLPIALGSAMVKGTMTGGAAGRALGHLVEDAGIESLLRSWLIVENHDTPRLASTLTEAADRRIVTALQLTLPGSPCIYYGEELGMTGKGDPENRAPMRWDLANDQNPDFVWMKKLLGIRKSRPALRLGDFKPLDTTHLLAYVRTTDRLRDATLIVVNPTGEVVTESFTTRVGRLMSWGNLEDLVGGKRVRSINGIMEVTMPPKSVAIFAPVIEKSGGYSPYDRIP